VVPYGISGPAWKEGQASPFGGRCSVVHASKDEAASDLG